MKDHYQLSDDNYQKLIDDGVTVEQMFKAMPLFDPNSKGVEVGFLSLVYYIDNKGDFNSPPFFAHKKIAQIVFDQLPIKEKIFVAEYIDENF